MILLKLKCIRCDSRNVIDIEEPKYRPFERMDGTIVMIYPLNKCVDCGHEFNMRINWDEKK